MNFLNENKISIIPDDWQMHFYSALEESTESIVVKKSREIGMSTVLKNYMRNHPEKSFLFVSSGMEDKLPNVDHRRYRGSVAGKAYDEIIFDEASFFNLEKILPEYLPSLKANGKSVIISTVNSQNDYFWKLTLNNSYKQLVYHWSLCPRLNPKYEEGGLDYSIVDNYKKNISNENFLTSFEMIPNSSTLNLDVTISFRLTKKQESELKEAIKLESLKGGRMLTKSEYIISKILPEYP